MLVGLLGLRECVGRPAAARWQGWPVRWGWLGREAEKAWALARLPPFSSFSVFFSFLLLCLNSNLVLEFEFKIGVPCSLEF